MGLRRTASLSLIACTGCAGGGRLRSAAGWLAASRRGGVCLAVSAWGGLYRPDTMYDSDASAFATPCAPHTLHHRKECEVSWSQSTRSGY
eukprot:scaffold40488_cov65-Phaeocystis_antarctica.AAC.6